MKITFVLPLYWPVIGGCELHTRELVNMLSKKHDVSIVTLISNQKDKVRFGDFWFSCMLSSPPTPEIYHDGKVSVTKLGVRFYEKILAFPFMRIQSPKVPSLIRRYSMQLLVHFYKKKLEHLIKEGDIIHGIHGNVSWMGYAALLVARERGIPFTYTPVSHLYQKENVLKHACEGNSFVRISDLHMTTRGPVTETWIKTCYEADALFTMTDFERRFFTENNVNKSSFTTGVGPIMLDTPNEDFKDKYGIKDKRIVLFLGRNNEDKGIKELLMSTRIVWNEFPDTCFVFVGPLEWGIENTFQVYQDPRILVCGPVKTKEKSAALSACDILCVPSVLESFGGIYLEAWVNRKPVVGANIAPFRELINNDKGGIAVKPTPDGIAEGILFLLKNPDIGTRMGEWGRQQVFSKYNWENISDKVEEVYFNLLDSNQD